MRRAAHIDANQPEIVEALRKLGATVTSLAGVGKGCPDLLVGYRGLTLLVEVKDRRKESVGKDGYTRKARPGSLEESQVEWLASWRGLPVIVAYTSEEAVAAVLAAVDAL